MCYISVYCRRASKPGTECLRSAEEVEQSLENLRQKMEAELEDRKLELLEEKEKGLSKIREDIEKDAALEEERLRREKEAAIKFVLTVFALINKCS